MMLRIRSRLRLIFRPALLLPVCAAVLAYNTLRALRVPQPLQTAVPRSEGVLSSPSIVRDSQAQPTDFSPEELAYLQRRFGVHGPQTPLAQLFTRGVDQLQPLRANTLHRLSELKPVILRESRRQHVNPMLIAGILYDEIQHSKPGEDLPFVAQSGLISTLGPAQLGISELIHQGRLPNEPTDEQIAEARRLLMDPEANIRLLAGKMSRLKSELGFSSATILMASRSAIDAKAIATLAYLHNGKLDYPVRILRYMQDPALHGLIYSRQRSPIGGLI